VIRLGIVGLGRMGLSHLAIANMHPLARVVAACESSSYIGSILNRYSGLTCYSSLERMLAAQTLDAVIIATPSSLHASMVHTALTHGLHVFCEKPFVLNPDEGQLLVALAETKKLVNQVGYHFRFVAAFEEAARIVASGALGIIHHVRTEAYGPVVLRSRGRTWRSTKEEGGGVLYDYACHALDLMHYVVGTPSAVDGVVLNRVFSANVEDEVYCTFRFEHGASGQLAVNWSDESYRKMMTRITVWGSRGRVTADRQECQVYLREPHPAVPDLKAGWTVRYTTELTEPVWYYLRGEEYSAQIDHFLHCISDRRVDGRNTFRSALEADRVVAMIAQSASSAAPLQSPAPGRDQRAMAKAHDPELNT
jgi:scyllo-inositol 2-dehydrogenase (NADP+)